MKKNSLVVLNTGLAYEIYSHGLLLCSKPSKKLAFSRAREIAFEFGLSSDIVYKHV